MSFGQLILLLYIFALSIFAGYQIISKVPQLLHTPLMAFTNAISGISLASLVVAGERNRRSRRSSGRSRWPRHDRRGRVPDHGRMLKMFRKKPGEPGATGQAGARS